MRLSFVRETAPVYLGGRSLGIGAARVRWGGRWYEVRPVTFLEALQLAGIMAERGTLELAEGGLAELPVDELRGLAHIIIQGVRAEDVRRASAGQLRILAVAFGKVNDWPWLYSWMVPKDDEKGGEPSEHAFDLAVVALGKEFGLWPYEVMRKPHAEVVAVMEYLRHVADELRKAAGVKEPTKEARDWIERESARVASEEAESDRKVAEARGA